MSYIIGMDGGGTKTHCIIASLEREVLFECTGRASNFLTIGTEKVCSNLFELMNECKEHLKIDFTEIKIILLGTTGAGRSNDAERLENAFHDFIKDRNINLNFHVESDARIALEAAFSGRPGSILIAGTGSIMFGKDSAGNIHRVGGFGRFIGDEGSGFSLGKKGLIAVSKEFDGRGSDTLLSKLVKEKFRIDTLEKLITEVYRNQFDIASAAPLVIEAAEKNDIAALKIIDEETDELVLHISAMAKKLRQHIFEVSFIGGIICNENIFSEKLREKIKNQLPNVVIKPAENPPAYGAVLMAKELLKKG